MKEISVDWIDIKSFVDSRSLSIQYLDIGGVYYIKAIDVNFVLSMELKQTTPKNSNQIDFEDNYISSSNKKLSDLDNDARSIVRVAAANKGASYKAHFFEFETSVLSSIHCESWLGMADMDFSMKFYKMDGTELTTQADVDTMCIKTVITFKPMYDYELVSGNVHMETKPTENLRMWVVGGAVELGDLGAREFIRNLNLKFIGADEGLHTDGRASKFMKKITMGVPYNTNQIQIIIKSANAGYKHKIMMALEIFKD